jgi:hypothetical protein
VKLNPIDNFDVGHIWSYAHADSFNLR